MEGSAIALCTVIVTPSAPVATVIHDAVLLAGRIATPLLVSHAGADYLIQPYDNCPAGCPQCADRNPDLIPKTRDLRWNPHA